MSDHLTAIKKFNCTACGAEAVWTPAKQTLVCPYCGTVSQAELKKDGSAVAELDLLPALENLPDDGGWVKSKKTVKCQSCHAISIFDPKRMAQNCDFCGSPSLIAADDIKAPVRPISLLPFQVADTKVREMIRQWYGSHWLAPNKLGNKALTDTLHGVYLPYWTFDSQVHSFWQAESGKYYHVKDRNGNTQTEVEWQDVDGQVEHYFDDLLVPASRGVHADLLAQVAPFPTTKELVPYDPGYLSGWVVEQYQIDLKHAAHAANESMEEAMHNYCARSVPGDTYRNLHVQSHYSCQTFKHVLLPVWLLTYNYGSKTYQVLVNGYTGKISGEYPISWIKVFILTLAALILLLLFLGLSER
jgi:Zn finger protein HypA/HybF involved in hydrogenase expression